MLSREIASKLDAGTGDSVKMLTAKTMTNGRIVLRPEEFRVTGVFSTGYYEVDSLTAFISLDKGEKIFSGEGFLSIQCKITDPYNDAGRVAVKISSYNFV